MALMPFPSAGSWGVLQRADRCRTAEGNRPARTEGHAAEPNGLLQAESSPIRGSDWHHASLDLPVLEHRPGQAVEPDRDDLSAW